MVLETAGTVFNDSVPYFWVKKKMKRTWAKGNMHLYVLQPNYNIKKKRLVVFLYAVFVHFVRKGA